MSDLKLNRADPSEQLAGGRDELTIPLLGWLYDTLGVSAQWSTCSAQEFTWWPGQLAQTVRILPSQGGLTRVVASTHLVREVPDVVFARHLLSKLNSGAAGYVFNLDGSHVWVETAHSLTGNSFEQNSIFAQSVITQAIVADQVASALANALGAVVATSAHPLSGSRTDPDQRLTLLITNWARPEPVLMTAITRRDIEKLADRVSAIMVTTVGDELGQVAVAEDYRTFEVALKFDEQAIPSIAAGRPAHLVVGLQTHQDFGDTFAVVLTSPLAVSPEEIPAAELLADMLNQVAVGPDHHERTALGAWWSREGQLCWSCYLPLTFTTALKAPSARGRIEQLAALVISLAGGRCAELIEAGFEYPLVATREPLVWRGLSLEPDFPLTVYPERAAGHQMMAKHMIGNPDSVLDVELADLGPRPDVELCTWGIFNPAGPTLTTIGLIHTDAGWLLAEWMRHPSLPLFRIHALLEDAEPDTVTRACRRVLIDRYGDTNLCPVPHGLPEFVLPTRGDPLSHVVPAALRRIGETCCNPTDLAEKAAFYRFFGGDPWARMGSTHEQYEAACSSLPEVTPSEAAEAWWAAASDREHVAGHVLAFGGAWDGVSEFLNMLAQGNQ